jgi:monothiol glutaredoxin
MNLIVKQNIEQLIHDHTIIIFMKGSKSEPMCGFSNSVIQIFNTFQIPYYTFNVLEDPNIRQGIKTYSDWPTIPQVYIKGEFIGGADIIMGLYQSKKLQEVIEGQLNS